MKYQTQQQSALSKVCSIIGKMSDRRVGEIAGVSKSTVLEYRQRHGIPCCDKTMSPYAKTWADRKRENSGQLCEVEGCQNYHVDKFRGQFLCVDHLNPDVVRTVEDFVIAKQSITCCFDSPPKNKPKARVRIRRTRKEIAEAKAKGEV